MASLFSLSTEKLMFTLSSSGSKITSLLVRNTSNGPIAFKIKTTQPSWYCVIPNQDVIPVGGSFKVHVSLVEEMNQTLLQLYQNRTKENLERHRFQVLALAISEKQFADFKALDDKLQAHATKDEIDGLQEGPHSAEYDSAHNIRAAKYTALWSESHSDAVQTMKLRVDYFYDTNKVRSGDDGDVFLRSQMHMQNMRDKFGPGSSHVAGTVPVSVSTNVDIVRNRLAKEWEQHPHGGEQEAMPSSHDEAVAKLISLRKKYDALANYTMHLTSERDTMKAKYETLQREIKREDNRRSKPQSTPGNDTATVGPTVLKEEDSTNGASIFSLATVVVIAYLLGRLASASNFFYGLFGT